MILPSGTADTENGRFIFKLHYRKTHPVFIRPNHKLCLSVSHIFSLKCCRFAPFTQKKSWYSRRQRSTKSGCIWRVWGAAARQTDTLLSVKAFRRASSWQASSPKTPTTSHHVWPLTWWSHRWDSLGEGWHPHRRADILLVSPLQGWDINCQSRRGHEATPMPSDLYSVKMKSPVDTKGHRLLY